MSRKDGPEIFAAWILLVQVASKCADRGVLKSSDGRPYDAAEIAVKTRAPEKIFVKALPHLCSVGWITSDQPAADSPDTSAESPDTSADPPDIAGANRIEQKGIEKNGTEKKTPLTPQNKFGGDLPPSLDFDSFLKVWLEWEQHRKEIRKPLKPMQIKKQLKRLGELGLTKAIEAINHTINMGWQGIREPEPEDPRKPSKKPGNNEPDEIIKDLERMAEDL